MLTALLSVCSEITDRPLRMLCKDNKYKLPQPDSLHSNGNKRCNYKSEITFFLKKTRISSLTFEKNSILIFLERNVNFHKIPFNSSNFHLNEITVVFKYI